MDLDESAHLLDTARTTTREQLQRAESRGLGRASEAYDFLASQRDDGGLWLLDDLGLRAFHREAFGEIWDWAGSYRRRESNIGVAPEAIAVAVRDAMDDARAWHDDGEVPAVEVALRLHHRLGRVHPFAGGNGRATRIWAELYLFAATGAELGWSEVALPDPLARRERYLGALREVDATGDIAALLAFATAG